ncbi:hypothetical protein SCHPADRAFT_999386 [Schizopora paradoxa]|uniref:Protein kinase domain-containing protein n=1 Tax=Schizopora paradoxa TaxID=27342 RepID=A0A0H2RFQ4_9AGAM|nr:hypothetical protein SCHPADRAFT_999386 [Schizopora paradoxa]
MTETRIEGLVSLVDTVFPDAVLELTSEEIEEILQINTLRRDGEWVSWPRKNATISELEMANFISLIREEVKTRFLPNANSRYCSSMFYDHPVPDPTSKTTSRLMPDIVFTMDHFKEEERHTVEWIDFVMVLELVSSEMLDKEISRCPSYCERMFDRQPVPRFVPATLIAESHIILIIFDRSGKVSSEKISVHNNHQKFLRLIFGFLFASLEHLGYETTVDDIGDGRLCMKAGGIEYRVKGVFRDPGVEGRGTVCFHGVSQVDRSEVVIKNSWVDVRNEQTEIDILNQLNERNEKDLCTPDGVRVIPQIVSHEVLKTKRPGAVPGEWIDVGATTALFRHELVEWDGNEPKWARISSDKSRKSKVEVRKLCRIVMKPFGQKLDTFPSKKVLVRAFGDIVHAIRVLHESGIVHRDISFRNILLYEHEGVLRGVLIDYDYAVSFERAASIAKRTGTLPFLSLDQLRETPLFPHNYFHDLESLFYVMIWTFTFYSGPNSQKRRFSKIQNRYHQMAVAKWNCEVVDGNLSALYSLKLGCVARLSFWDTLDQFDPYFTDPDLSRCMWAIRDLIIDPEMDYRRNFESFLKTKAKLDDRFDLEETSPEKMLLIMEEYNRIPINMRPPSVVFGSLLAILEETASLFQVEEAVEDGEKGVDTEVAYNPGNEGRDEEVEATKAAVAPY